MTRRFIYKFITYFKGCLNNKFEYISWLGFQKKTVMYFVLLVVICINKIITPLFIFSNTFFKFQVLMFCYYKKHCYI